MRVHGLDSATRAGALRRFLFRAIVSGAVSVDVSPAARRHCIAFIDPRILSLPQLRYVDASEQRGPGAVSIPLVNSFYNRSATKVLVDERFGPHACRAAVIALYHAHRKKLPAARKPHIHKDVLMYIIAPLLWAGRYETDWRNEPARAPARKL